MKGDPTEIEIAALVGVAAELLDWAMPSVPCPNAEKRDVPLWWMPHVTESVWVCPPTCPTCRGAGRLTRDWDGVDAFAIDSARSQVGGRTMHVDDTEHVGWWPGEACPRCGHVADVHPIETSGCASCGEPCSTTSWADYRRTGIEIKRPDDRVVSATWDELIPAVARDRTTADQEALF